MPAVTTQTKNTESKLDLNQACDALQLPHGRLEEGLAETRLVTITDDFLLDAAAVLIAKNDARGLRSKAEVVFRAWDRHGFCATNYHVDPPHNNA